MMNNLFICVDQISIIPPSIITFYDCVKKCSGNFAVMITKWRENLVEVEQEIQGIEEKKQDLQYFHSVDHGLLKRVV